jgi:site-specific DNA recombinase
MRAVIYARYSSDNQREASIEDQVRLARAHIESRGWTYLHAYNDRAISGASALRPGYQRLLADARDRQFDVVVAEALDRLSRDQEDVAALYKRLTFVGIRIVTLAEGEVGELHVGLKGTMNALFLKDLAQKTRRGLEGRVREGRSAGGLCYGYTVVRETDMRGEPVRGGRRIDEAEAAVVRRIFEQFAAGMSANAIAKQLNAEGVPGPRGLLWRDTAIRGHRQRGTGILNNELYIGRLVWNRLRYVKDPETGKRRSLRNGADDLVVEAVPDLRIVDDELWHRVKLRQDEIDGTPAVQKIKASGFWQRRRAAHLLTGLVHCGVCGGGYAAVGRDYLACSAARKLGTCEHRKAIRRPDLEHLILDALKHRLMQPEAVRTFTAELHAEINRSHRDGEVERARLQREHDRVKAKLEGLYDAIAEGLRTEGLLQRIKGMEAEKDRLAAALDRPAPSPVRLHPNLAEIYRTKVADLHRALEDPAIRDEALHILRGLVERIVITPAAEGPGETIELVGAIARMVALGNKKAALDARTACSVKVVAGAGFEPATFRL